MSLSKKEVMRREPIECPKCTDIYWFTTFERSYRDHCRAVVERYFEGPCARCTSDRVPSESGWPYLPRVLSASDEFRIAWDSDNKMLADIKREKDVIVSDIMEWVETTDLKNLSSDPHWVRYPDNPDRVSDYEMAKRMDDKRPWWEQAAESAEEIIE
jgi:hypothetical protein